jgi:homoserine dehydrogenase
MLIAEHLDEISRLVKQNPGAQFAYEAAVCGGIPIIHVLKSCYAGDVIHEVMVSSMEQQCCHCCF